MIRLFFASLAHRWYEHALGALVVALTVASITVLQTLTESAESDVHELAHKLGKNMLVVPSDMDLPGFYQQRYDDSALDPAAPARVYDSELSEHISVVEPRLYGNAQVKGSDLVMMGQQTYLKGQPKGPSDSTSATVGPDAAAALDLAVPAELSIGGVDLSVAAVADPVPGGIDRGVFASLGATQQALHRPDAINAMRLAGCWCRVDVPTLAGDVESTLPGSRALTLAGLLKAQKGTIAEVGRYSRLLYLAAVVLMAAIAASLAMSQARRQRRELGLLLAVGTSPRLLGAIFVAKAALMGALGAVVGHLLGGPLSERVAADLIGMPLEAAPGSLGPLLGMAVGVCIAAALLPAWRGVRLDPTEVLRES